MGAFFNKRGEAGGSGVGGEAVGRICVWYVCFWVERRSGEL